MTWQHIADLNGLPRYGDKPGLLQWLADYAAKSAAAQQGDPKARRQSAIVLKRFILLKPTQQQFCDAMRGIVLTPELLYTLFIHQPKGRE